MTINSGIVVFFDLSQINTEEVLSNLDYIHK